MKKTKNQVLKKKNKKLFLIIWMFVILNIYVCLSINLNPINNDLRQRGNFFSFPIAVKLINKENSELIHGSENEGSVMTLIKVPKEYVNKELDLRIEADTKSIWNYTFDTNGEEYFPSRDLRIELIINGKINNVFNFSEIPKSYYSSKTGYSNLFLSNRGSRLSCAEKFEADSSRNTIIIRLLTNHSLRMGKEIFADYFYKDNYRLIICIGDPDIFFCLSSIIIFLNWFICITVIILKRKFYVLIDFYKYMIQEFYYEFKLFIKLKNQIEPYLKIIFKE